MAKYRVKQNDIVLYPTLQTQLDGVPVSLTGKAHTYSRVMRKGHPPVQVTAQPATQAQLERLYNEGNPHVELDPSDADAKAALATAKPEAGK